MSRIITLLTDFGLRDAYVGAMKGVIASLAPGVPVIDIAHEIEPHAVRRAGLVWAAATPYFPEGTVHVAVVDPGVGSRRKILAVSGRGAVFLVPDNGLIGYVLKRREVAQVREVRCRELFLASVSQTFHGRDIFAPVAARIALGLSLEEVGPAARTYRREELPVVQRRTRGGVLELRGEVIDDDRFGNLITNLRPPPRARFLGLEVAGMRLARLAGSYASVRNGEALAIVGSSGFIEIAVAQGSAAATLGLTMGETAVGCWRFTPLARGRGRPGPR